MIGPVALGFTEGLTPIEELVKRVEAGHHDFAIMLAGGLALSRKTIHYDAPDTWHITNDIDGTSQTLPEAGLWESSNIGLALDRRALLDMSGDPMLDIEDRGPVLGSTLTDEARALKEEQRKEEEGALTFTLNSCPGALRVGEPNEDHVDHGEWQPADPFLMLGVCEIGPATVAEIDLQAVSFDGKAATTSIELTIEDIDDLITTLTAIKEDAIANRGFALREDGFWTNGEE